VADGRHVDAPRGHVGGHEHAQAAAAQLVISSSGIRSRIRKTV
jgi:hypothetical protein